MAIDTGKVEFTSDAVVFSNIDSPGDTAIGMLIYWTSDDVDANSIPLVFCDTTDEPFIDNNLKTITFNCPADGWLNQNPV